MVTAIDGSSSMIGSIDLKCEISPIISQAYMAARDICEYHYMTAPELDYRYGCKNITMTLIQISPLFSSGFFSKTNYQMMI
jgi:hypothetical protein